MTSIDELRANVACSFCLKPTKEVTAMVAGPGVFICDACVALCVEIIEAKQDGEYAVSKWEQDLTDDGLLEHLPKIAALQAQVERQLTAWVRHVRTRGITWARIGAALDMTRQSAWERFSGEE